MKKIVLLIFVLSLTACNSGSGGSDSSAALTSVASCQDLGINGTWNGTISGNADTMVIANNCATTSSYCQSNSTVTIVSRNSSCTAGISECGVLTFKTTNNNGSGFCASVGVTYSCSYQVNTASTALSYDCGGGALIYTR